MKQTLYPDGRPAHDFNRLLLDWMDNRVLLKEHGPLNDTFRATLDHYQNVRKDLQTVTPDAPADREVLNVLTDVMLNVDIAKVLQKRLQSTVNKGGFRSEVSQGQAKNTGENFVNLLCYNLATTFRDDAICVDKGLPPALKKELTLQWTIKFGTKPEVLSTLIEGDLSIFARDDPLNAIVLSCKTRLKEVFHIGTMWAQLLGMARSDALPTTWGVTGKRRLEQVQYCFATADMISGGAANSQGGDVERDEPRNLIKWDASFFDHVFVSKSGIAHTQKRIVDGRREAYFAELGCLHDLIRHKFGLQA